MGESRACVRRCPPLSAVRPCLPGHCRRSLSVECRRSSSVGLLCFSRSLRRRPRGTKPASVALCCSAVVVAVRRRSQAAPKRSFLVFRARNLAGKSRTPRNRTFSPAENQIRYFRGRIVNRTSAPVTVSTISTLAPCYAFRSFEVCGRCGRRRCIQGCVCCDVTGRKRGQWHRHDGGEVGGVERRQNRGGTERAFVRFSLSVHRERTSADAARPRCHAACVGGVCVGTAAGAEYAYTFTRVLINSRNLWWA